MCSSMRGRWRPLSLLVVVLTFAACAKYTPRPPWQGPAITEPHATLKFRSRVPLAAGEHATLYFGAEGGTIHVNTQRLSEDYQYETRVRPIAQDVSISASISRIESAQYYTPSRCDFDVVGRPFCLEAGYVDATKTSDLGECQRGLWLPTKPGFVYELDFYWQSTKQSCTLSCVERSARTGKANPCQKVHFPAAMPNVRRSRELEQMSLRHAAQAAHAMFSECTTTKGEDSRECAVQDATSAYYSAVEYLEQCKSGDWDACWNAADSLVAGTGVRRDVPRAMALYTGACERGHAMGCTRLGSLYTAGKLVKKDFQRGLLLHTRACEVGREKNACFLLGLAYQYGPDLPKDLCRARSYYQLACDNGSSYPCTLAAQRGRSWSGDGCSKP
ncbi:MAG: hypothetical protein RLZZ450_2723 [Pseudomonadota bacterium]